MIDEIAIQLAMRARALTLSLATTGLITMSVEVGSGAGDPVYGQWFERTAGSFVVDGFYPGMEVTTSGFGGPADGATFTVTAVTVLKLYAGVIDPDSIGQAATTNTRVAVGFPSQRAWENVAFEPTVGVPWVREELLPGATMQTTLGPFSALDTLPMYVLSINLPAETGLTVKRYINALRVLFAPDTTIVLSNGDILKVRADAGPYTGQLQQGRPGFVVQPFFIPLRVRSFNSI